MYQIKGKYGIINIMTNEKEIDKEIHDSLQKLINYHMFKNSYISIMPDYHLGVGSVIGFTMKMNDYIIPNIIGVDENCLDEETEFLTKSGWKKIKDYSKDDLVLQYDKNTDCANFIKPLNYIKKGCNEFYHFKNSKGLDQMVSEEHKVLIWKGHKKNGYKIEDFSVKDLFKLNNENKLKKNYYNIKSSFIIKNKNLNITEEKIRLDIMISADGYIRSEKKFLNYIELHLKKQRKIERAEYLLKLNNIYYKKSILKDKSTSIRFNVFKDINKDLSKYFNASYEQLKIVAEESLFWDGHKGYRSCFCSTNKTNADVVQYAFSAINIRAGISSNIKVKKKEHNECFIVTPTKNNYIGLTNIEKIKLDELKFKYCFTVPSGYFVIRRNGKISITGNCGVLNINLGKINIDLKTLDNFIKNNIPHGFSRYNKDNCYNDNENNKITEIALNINYKWEEINDIFNQIGTLGGGNHFIEIEKDDEDNKYLTIHTGSRNFGYKYCNFYQNKAIENLEKHNIKDIPKELAYLTNDNHYYHEYLKGLDTISEFAKRNRFSIADKICNFLNLDINNLEKIETVHNYIDLENKIIRKGAISAQKDELVIIPINMRDGVIIGKGKGNSKYNFSAPHGAGRVLSRIKAKEQINIKDFENSMSEIFSTCINEKTIDESPFVYKNIEYIKENIKETIDIIKIIKPIYNFKSF